MQIIPHFMERMTPGQFSGLTRLRAIAIIVPVLFAVVIGFFSDFVLLPLVGKLQARIMATLLVVAGAAVFSLTVFELLGRAWQRLEHQREELRRVNRQLLDARTQAATDALTGLSNHRAFHQDVRDKVSEAEKKSSPVGLLMLDIDNFKPINDCFGHLAGDEVLRSLALTMIKVVGHKRAYRYGGDEFAVLLPAANYEQLIEVAEQLREAIEGETFAKEVRITASVGVACFPHMAGSAEELVYEADAAMYWAKSEGKNRVGAWRRLVNRGDNGHWHPEAGLKPPDPVAALIGALAAKDPTTRSHTERCSLFVRRLVEELNIEPEEQEIISLAALLHDIGKLVVPNEILFKPGPLDEEEWEQIRRHPEAARHILGQLVPIVSTIPAILHHHEHFDGSGYPGGLKGQDIPLASRILLVVDAYDAMTSDRPYRKAMMHEAAVQELKRSTGRQFDPKVVEAFLRVLEQGRAYDACGRQAAGQNGS